MKVIYWASLLVINVTMLIWNIAEGDYGWAMLSLVGLVFSIYLVTDAVRNQP